METKDIPLDNLLLDPNNYRLQEVSGYVSVPSERFQLEQVQKTTLQRLQVEGLRELQKSIIANGFLPIERIVVAAHAGAEDQYLVIEGNRRVAALRGLRDQVNAGIEIPSNVTAVFDAVPCIVATDDPKFPFFRETLMGVRHVGGIKQWGGYQRAKLIVDLKDDHELEAPEIADRLGLSVQEVNRRYRAFKALQQMELNEDYAEYADPSKYPLFHEAMSLPVVRNWLGWNETDLKFDNVENEEHFYQLITPRQDEETGKSPPPKLKTFGDVRELKRILPNAEAKSLLFDETRTFLDALTIARKDEISKKWRSEVSEATQALQSIGAMELATLNADELATIKNLKSIVEHVLGLHSKITATG